LSIFVLVNVYQLYHVLLQSVHFCKYNTFVLVFYPVLVKVSKHIVIVDLIHISWWLKIYWLVDWSLLKVK
jgi:hypothetical protein